jgi:glycerophosphoryl diester phosphodiesterase
MVVRNEGAAGGSRIGLDVADAGEHHRPLVVAHRGASADAPENTLAAFELAHERGADGIEFDVRLAADGVPVVIHDETLQRTAALDHAVSSLTSAELARLDAGSWFNRCRPARSRPDFAREGVPTLARVLDLFGPRFRMLYVELKCGDADRRPLVETAVSVLGQRAEVARRSVVKSFDLMAVAQVKLLAPVQRTVALFGHRPGAPVITTSDMIERARDCGADMLGPHRSLVTRRRVEAARAAGLPVAVWTVDHPAWARRGREWGLRALITNRPARLLDALSAAQGASDRQAG